MKKALAALVGLCCLAAFSNQAIAAPKKNVKGKNFGKGQGQTVNSSEHSSVRGTINGGGDFI